MAKFCTQCGKKIGFFDLSQGDLCQDCFNKNEEEKKKIEEEKALEQRKALLQNIRQKVDNGEIVYLYKYIYLQVDSYLFNKKINAGPLIGPLIEAGFQGWEIVGIIHRTVSYELETEYTGSSSGHAFGGSTAGISGVYALARNQFKDNKDYTDDQLLKYIEDYI